MGLKRYFPKGRPQKIHEPNQISETLRSATGGGCHANRPLIVSGQMSGINTPEPSTKNTGEKVLVTPETSEQLMLTQFQTTICSRRDFLARVSALLEKGGDLRTQGEHYFLTSAESFELNDPAIVCLKTSKDSYPTTTGKLSRLSWNRWQNWGMTANGRCLTARISEFPRIGKECSLSDILEKNPNQKYFLSEKSMKTLEREIQKGRNISPLRLRPVIEKETPGEPT